MLQLVSHDKLTLVCVHRETESVSFFREIVSYETVSLLEGRKDVFAVFFKEKGRGFGKEQMRADAPEMVSVWVKMECEWADLFFQIMGIHTPHSDNGPLAFLDQRIPQGQSSFRRPGGHSFREEGMDQGRTIALSNARKFAQLVPELYAGEPFHSPIPPGKGTFVEKGQSILDGVGKEGEPTTALNLVNQALGVFSIG